MPSEKRLLDPATFFFDFTPEMVRRLNARGCFDGPDTAAMWGRYLIDRNRADFDSLFNHYLPVVWFEARKVKRNSPWLFPEPLGDYVSDASLGLISAIAMIRFFAPGGTMLTIRKGVRRAIWNQSRERSWAGRKRIESVRTIQIIRSDLTTKLGRLPEREEIAKALAAKVKNPDIYFFYLDEGIASMVPRSQMEKKDDRTIRQYEDPNSPDPSEKVMDDEIVRLAMKGLSSQDKKILRLTLAGICVSDIARELEIPRCQVARRLNGVL